MGLCIYYRSVEPMHPALAFEINEHADQLLSQYIWLSCEPVILSQSSDGFLRGESKPNFAPKSSDAELAELGNLPDGTVMTMVEVLCQLSRDHDVDWELGHDYEPDSIGRISRGVADESLMEQLETLDSIGDLLEELEDSEPGYELNAAPIGLHGFNADSGRSDEEEDDDEPRLLKFPGA